MSRSPFGWDLPPGCSHADLERAMGGDAREPTVFEDELLDVLQTLEPIKRDEIELMVMELMDVTLELAELCGQMLLKLPPDPEYKCSCGHNPPKHEEQKDPNCVIHGFGEYPETLRQEVQATLRVFERVVNNPKKGD